MAEKKARDVIKAKRLEKKVTIERVFGLIRAVSGGRLKAKLAGRQCDLLKLLEADLDLNA